MIQRSNVDFRMIFKIIIIMIMKNNNDNNNITQCATLLRGHAINYSFEIRGTFTGVCITRFSTIVQKR